MRWRGLRQAAPPVAAVLSFSPLLRSPGFFTDPVPSWLPAPPHLPGVLLHAANAWLLGRLFARAMDERAAWTAALLFAVAPMHAPTLGGLSGQYVLAAAFLVLSACLVLQSLCLSLWSEPHRRAQLTVGLPLAVAAAWVLGRAALAWRGAGAGLLGEESLWYAPAAVLAGGAGWLMARAATHSAGFRTPAAIAVAACAAALGATSAQATLSWSSDLAYYREAVQRHPLSGAAHRGLGVAWASRGRMEQARDEFEEAIRVSPWDGEAFYQLGKLLLQSGDEGQGRRWLSRATELEADPTQAWLLLASDAERRGQAKLAQAYLRRAHPQLNGNPNGSR